MTRDLTSRLFSAPVRHWFDTAFDAPTDVQEAAWQSIREKDNRFTVVVVDGASDPPTRIDADRYPFEVVP